MTECNVYIQNTLRQLTLVTELKYMLLIKPILSSENTARSALQLNRSAYILYVVELKYILLSVLV